MKTFRAGLLAVTILALPLSAAVAQTQQGPAAPGGGAAPSDMSAGATTVTEEHRSPDLGWLGLIGLAGLLGLRKKPTTVVHSDATARRPQ